MTVWRIAWGTILTTCIYYIYSQSYCDKIGALMLGACVLILNYIMLHVIDIAIEIHEDTKNTLKKTHFYDNAHDINAIKELIKLKEVFHIETDKNTLDGTNVLHYAIIHGNHEMLQLLLDYLPKQATQQMAHIGTEHHSLLLTALLVARLDIIQLLVQHGAADWPFKEDQIQILTGRINDSISEGRNPALQLTLKAAALIPPIWSAAVSNCSTTSGISPLLMSVVSDNVKALGIILSNRPPNTLLDINYRDNKSMTALTHALDKADALKARMLLDAGAIPGPRELMSADPHFWAQDDTSLGCMICNTNFTLLFRRHHCRCCGKVVCSNCAPSGNMRRIEGLRILDGDIVACSNDPLLHCRQCFRSPSIKWAD